jgi:hypothetical protein
MTDSWLDALSKLVEDEWNEHGYALLLSRVPALLGAQGFETETILQGRKLRPFLEAETAGRFRVIRSDPNSIIWGLVPATAEVSEPFARYFRRSSGPKPPRFAPSAWKAFTLPIPEGKRRWIFDEPSIHFRDEDSDVHPEGGHEIERRFIVSAGEEPEEGDVYRAAVVASIGSWGSETGVDPTRFALGRKKKPLAKPEQVRRSEITAFDQLVALLQPGELSRISLPLDIVVRLKASVPRV